MVSMVKVEALINYVNNFVCVETQYPVLSKNEHIPGNSPSKMCLRKQVLPPSYSCSRNKLFSGGRGEGIGPWLKPLLNELSYG